MQISFKVQGSASVPYDVVFKKQADGKLSASCSCKAGKNGQSCKHRFNILEGITKGIVSDNLEDVEIVQSWLHGTNLEQAINKMRELESEKEKIEKELKNTKKVVSNEMNN
jgi:hypothetical protein